MCKSKKARTFMGIGNKGRTLLLCEDCMEGIAASMNAFFLLGNEKKID